MYDPIANGLTLLDAQAPTKNITVQADPGEPRRRTYNVPTMDGRHQTVHAMPVADSLFESRLELFSMTTRELPVDAQLLLGLLAISRDFRHARLCVFDPQKPALTVVASFVPDELHEGSGPRLLHALREVASIADSLEMQLTGVDVE